MQEFSITMEDEPGALAACCEAIGASGANILAVAGVGDSSPTAAIVTDNAEATAAALDGIGVNYRVSTLNTVTLPHSPGSLAEFTRGLANDGVNLRSLYVLSISGDSAEVGYTTE